MHDALVLEARNVDVILGGRRVLQHVTIGLGRGATHLVGVNGAGKTTLMRCIAGMLRPSQGEVRFTRDSDRSTAARVALVPQTPQMANWLTCAQYVAYSAYLAGFPRSTMGVRVHDALALVNLDARASQRSDQISGGMQKRLAVAAALATEPDVILLDEPTAGLDPLAREDLRVLIREIAVAHAVLISTHLLEDVAAIGGRLEVLHEGRVRFSGSLDSFMGQPAITATEADLSRALRDLIARAPQR